jgi:AcrR family transcriptional regulator
MTMTDGTARRGRPRSERAQGAILDAAAELLLTHGLLRVSMDEVAERAGVSKATIYRRWSTKESLALDALYREWSLAEPSVRTSGSLRADLIGMMGPWVRLLARRPYACVLAALIEAAQRDPSFGEEYRARFLGPRRRRAAVVFRHAIERGEIAADTDVELTLDLLYGPLYHRLLHRHAPLDDRFVGNVVDSVVGSLSAAPPAVGAAAGTRA